MRLSFSKHKSVWAAFTFRVIQLYTYTHIYTHICIYIKYEKALLVDKMNETNQDRIYKKYPWTPTI